MRIYWLKCREAQEEFDIYWGKGATNLADYFTKHHSQAHHKAVRPIYLLDEKQWLSAAGCTKVLQDCATSGKRVRLSQSSEGGKAVPGQAVAEPGASQLSQPCNLNQRIQTLLETLQGGRIRA